MLLWHEHTWGAAASVSERPTGRRRAVEYKRAFASRDRSRGALRRGGPSQARRAAGGRDREHPRAPRAAASWSSPPGDHAPGARDRLVGHVLPSQSSPTGRSRSRCPGSRAGSRDADRHRGRRRPPRRATASGTTLENDALRVELDPATGAIRRLLDRAAGGGRRPQASSATLRSRPRPRPGAGRGPGHDHRRESGPLVAVLRAEGQARARAAPLSAIASSPDKTASRSSSSSTSSRSREGERPPHLRPRGRGRRPPDRPGHESHGPGEGRPSRSCRDFVGVHSALDAVGRRAASPSASSTARSWSSDDGGRAAEPGRDPPLEAGALRGTTVHAYLLNNYWHTNYKADQQGLLASASCSGRTVSSRPSP